MVNKLPAPTIEPQLFGGFTVHFVVRIKEDTQIHNVTILDAASADTFYQDKLSRWAIDPLLRWCNQQENLANVQQLTFAARKESINKLSKLTRAFLALPNIQVVQCAEFIRDRAIPGLERSFPGKSSKYYQYSCDLIAYLDNLVPKLVTIYLSPIIAHQKATT